MIFTVRRSALGAAVLGAFALAGCGSSGDTVEAEDASAGEVAEMVADADMPRPRAGRWESETSMEIKGDMPAMPDMPDLSDVPPEMREQIKKNMESMLQRKHTFTSTSCLTPEEAEKSGEELFKPDQSDDCKFEKFSLGGGKLDAVMVCKVDAQTMTTKMNGTYSADSYTMNGEAEGMMVQGKPMGMAISVKAKRVGECDGTEES